MASRGSIISSAKHIPGGARSTAAPQGGSGAAGISSLAAQLGNAGSPQGENWARTYGGFLPRPPQDFTEGAFGPFSPILPVPVDAPPPGAERAEPRREEYRVGWNLPVGQPGTEGIKLADFSTLRTLADLYSVARACIQLRKSEIRALEWDIMPTSDAAKMMRNDHKAMKEFGERREKAIKFFRRPDPDYFSWNSWIDAVLEEVFVYDALSILIRPKWLKGRGKGLLGSDLDSLALISGSTIRPLYDINGSYPRPPAPAYQQYLYGVPRSDLMTMITERDIEEAGLSGSELKSFRGDQLLYLPMVPRRWTPYGFPPIERALVPVMTGLQKQAYQLDYFREGTVPAVFVSPGGANQNMTPNQIRELQDALNAIAGDPAWKHKIIVLPADSNVMPQKQTQIADQFDEIVMNQVCMAFDVQPMELGIMPKVSTTTSPGAANQMSKATQDIQSRKATKPTLTFLADIMTTILREVAGQDDMRFVFEGLTEEEDESIKTELLVSQIGAGLRSIDEAREELNLQPWGLPETSDPGWSTPNGWVPLVEATEARLAGADATAVFELPEGKPRATQMLTSAAPQGMPPTDQAIGYTPPGKAPGGKMPTGSGPASSASANGQKPRVNPIMSGRPAAMASGQGATTAASPGHTAAAGAGVGADGKKSTAKKTPAKKPAVAPVKKTTAKKPVSPGKAKAIESELNALARHVRKGRDVSDWKPRHISWTLLARVAEARVHNPNIEDAIHVVKASRRVDLDGQVVWLDSDLNQVENIAGGGGRVFPAHNAEGIEVPGGTPGVSAGGEPPRWTPRDGNSEGTFAHHPKGGDDSAMPSRRDVPQRPERWPSGNLGTEQADNGSPPGAVKSIVGNVSTAEVRAVMRKNFPPEALKWVDEASWRAEIVALHDIDFDSEDSWAAHHEMDHVREFVSRLERGERLNRPIMVRVPGHHRVRIVDGHHRILAYRMLGKPVPAFVGQIHDETDRRWSETHSYQIHQGDDPANKGEIELPVAAGIAIVASDTGRVLMLQRAVIDDDPAAGTWEFPGGCLENGEMPVQGAEREWQEETGCNLPVRRLTGTWTASNGRYQGFVALIEFESDVSLDDRDDVINPDDPDGDHFEALAWWDPDHLEDNPALRPELAADLDQFLTLVRSARE